MNEAIQQKEGGVSPPCPVFGECGGCLYQDLPYAQELRVKGEILKRLLWEEAGVDSSLFQEVVASPEEYHYRHRLDLNLRRIKSGELLMGFMAEGRQKVVSLESCAIARREISDFLPELKRQAFAKLPADYRVASLCIKTGDDGRVLWGGIGRRSLRLSEKDYLFTEVWGKKIFYSMETFFQNNLSILPKFFERLLEMEDFRPDTVFLDLYSGVGLFSVILSDIVKKVVMVEESLPSVQMSRFNVAYHGIQNAEISLAKVEDELPRVLAETDAERCIALVDPPRKGLAPGACEALSRNQDLRTLFYLSCQPESLARDLKSFLKEGWRVSQVTPFDFFPKTKHLETLVLLKR